MTTYNTPLPCHELTEAIIGIYYSVLSTFSAPGGVPEKVFRDAFAQRLKKSRLKVEVEKKIDVHNSAMRADLVVEDLVVIELKNVAHLSDRHLQQGTTYMEYGGYPVGLIFNYGHPDDPSQAFASSCALSQGAQKMSWLQVINSTSEKQGARKLLEAITQLPPVPQALQLLDNQDANISRVGDWLQNRIIVAFREDEERSEGLQRDLKYQAHQAASLQSILEAFHAHPMEQRAGKRNKPSWSQSSNCVKRSANSPQRWSDMSRSLPRMPRSSRRCGQKMSN